MSTRAYSAVSSTSALAPTTIERRAVGAHDVHIDIAFCGVCHSDLHQARNEWNGSTYPCVPGHEIVGKVSEVGSAVEKFAVGDLAGVGCMVDSCRSCPACSAGLQQYCVNRPTYTYNSEDRKYGGHTLGGYSQAVVVDEAFTLRMPKNLDLAASAPLLCAGITTYSPLRHWKVKKGDKVGVVGLGGLGHMGIKFAKAFGAHVVTFTTSPKKVEDAIRLGSHEVVVSTDAVQMAKHAGSFSFILDTVSADHDIGALLAQLQLDGNLTLVGAPEKPMSLGAFGLITNRRSLSGSGIGGIEETQEMLDFCSEHSISCDIEKIAMSQINDAYARLLKSDVRYRFVIDMATLA